MNIPDEAVEAAAGVILRGQDEGHHAWKIAYAALDAAAPHLMVEALEDAAKTFSVCSPEGEYSSTPEQVITWMRDYAEFCRSAGGGE
jgi:hypothetical protein